MITHIKKLLVVEDDRDVKFVMDAMLMRAGYEVVNAYNGREGVDQYRAHSPDLVLMDIRMPVMSGDEAIREIKAFDPRARILAVTAFNYTEGELGVPVLCKGFLSEELFASIERHFGLPLAN